MSQWILVSSSKTMSKTIPLRQCQIIAREKVHFSGILNNPVAVQERTMHAVLERELSY
jgi:hypothetical protein